MNSFQRDIRELAIQMSVELHENRRCFQKYLLLLGSFWVLRYNDSETTIQWNKEIVSRLGLPLAAIRFYYQFGSHANWYAINACQYWCIVTVTIAKHPNEMEFRKRMSREAHDTSVVRHISWVSTCSFNEWAASKKKKKKKGGDGELSNSWRE